MEKLREVEKVSSSKHRGAGNLKSPLRITIPIQECTGLRQQVRAASSHQHAVNAARMKRISTTLSVTDSVESSHAMR
jgi:hypothetical protein